MTDILTNGLAWTIFCVFLISLQVAIRSLPKKRRGSTKERAAAAAKAAVEASSASKSEDRRERLVSALRRMALDPSTTPAERENARTRLRELRSDVVAEPQVEVPLVVVSSAEALTRMVFALSWRVGLRVDSEAMSYALVRAVGWTVLYGYMIAVSTILGRVMEIILQGSVV